MQGFFKFIIGFVMGCTFTLWVSENPKPVTIEKVIRETVSEPKSPDYCKNKGKIEVAFDTCNQFLSSFMAKVDKLQDEIKWKEQQILNCHDEIKYYQGEINHANQPAD